MATATLQFIAQALNGKLWERGDMRRVYLDRGYNTKKMSTKCYIFERKDGTFGVSVTITCDSQADEWITSQQEQLGNSIWQEIQDAIADGGVAMPIAPEPAATVDQSEPQVRGYYMRWAEVRVPINSYGKLATRKRQLVHSYSGAISKAPAGFVAINTDAEWQKVVNLELQKRAFEYGETPNLAI